jgi:hypothetical protein
LPPRGRERGELLFSTRVLFESEIGGVLKGWHMAMEGAREAVYDRCGVGWLLKKESKGSVVKVPW